ncbi:MAG TPA: class I SAM-dependent methyltransferase [Rhodocyclaceae bacterium]|nr:class I SAM-dependent methyltransferase [Rhodocyclaceae bacterium]
MSVFDLYAAYYDLLYRDKDYAGEVDYLLGLIEGAAPQPRSILELGCGTGGHALELAKRGCSVHGIDLSRSMVERARQRGAARAPNEAVRLEFEVGDVRSYRVDRIFDAAVSMFHVMSYQTGNDDQSAAFATARRHLPVGGLFVFDFWYGPAVLSDRPRDVVKRVSDERIEVTRKTTPTMQVNLNRVDVRFDVDIASRTGGDTRQLSETHRMRYLFLPEIERLLRSTAFELLSAQAWLTREPLDDRTWYGCVVARAT